MIIKQRRIRSLANLRFVHQGETIVLGIKMEHVPNSLLKQIGFSSAPVNGETVLPAPLFGPISRYNADGRVMVHKNLPMETAYRQIEWHWTEWRGRYDSEEQSKIVDVPYKRYPRTFISPPGVELTVSQVDNDEVAVVIQPITLTVENKELVLHAVNLFLEIFGECQIFSEKLEDIFKAPLRRLNWQILPPGRRPWDQLKREVDQILKDAPKGNQIVIEYRFKVINGYNPEFLAIGRAGFRGYVIFGFPSKNLHVLESIYLGNATYVFAENWEELSQKTKAEILDASLQEDRIIHREGWGKKVKTLLRSN